MKKILTKTIIACILLNLIMTNHILAQNAVETPPAQVGEAKKQLFAEDQMVTTGYGDMLSNIQAPQVTLSRLRRGGSGSVLVIPTNEMKIENLAAIHEDMNVMSRIFDKKLGQLNEQTPGGRLLVDINRYYYGRGNRTTEAIYLEGYGALFLMKVNMLLSAPPETPKEEKAEGEDADPLWAQMRREMYEPEEARRNRTSDRPEEQYSALLVGNLKASLIKTLKHAANIRGLEPEQLVILTVIGNGSRSTSTITRSYSYSSRGSGSSYSRSSSPRRIVQTTPGDKTDSLLPTVLTIFVKKSDIDAFAKGEIDYDQFRKRTSIFKSYAKAGQQTSLGLEEYEVAEANAGL